MRGARGADGEYQGISSSTRYEVPGTRYGVRGTPDPARPASITRHESLRPVGVPRTSYPVPGTPYCWESLRSGATPSIRRARTRALPHFNSLRSACVESANHSHTAPMPTPSRRALRHVLVALAAVGSCTIGVASRAPAQSTAVPAEGWSWAQLRDIPGVDSTQLASLEANVLRLVAVKLFAMLGVLSKSQAARHSSSRPRRRAAVAGRRRVGTDANRRPTARALCGGSQLRCVPSHRASLDRSAAWASLLQMCRG